MKPIKIIIVGGVAAGASAAAKARRCDENAEIILFEKGEEISYATCGLPYYLSGVIDNRDKLIVTKASLFRKRFKIDVRTKHEVVKIERVEKKVTCIDLITGKKYEEDYDKLILTPGSKSIIPSIPGIELPFVSCLKTLEDTDKIANLILTRKPESVVIVGAGLIGLESAENLKRIGAAVSVVEFMPQILAFLDFEMAELVNRHVNENNVKTLLGERVVAIREENGAGIIETDTGQILPADLIIMSVGTRPDTELAKDAGLEIGDTGAVKVDEYMKTSDPDIFAAGDCVESFHLVTEKPAIFPMAGAANKQGRAAGANVLGRRLPVKGFTGTVIVKVFDLCVAKTGLSEKEAVDAGFNPYVSYVIANDHAGYYPGAKVLRIKTVAEHESGRILGVQIIGENGVDKRIDVFATAIYNKMTVEDLMHLDLAYAPPFSSARDPIFVCGAIGQNFYNDDYLPVTPAKLNNELKSDVDILVIDVRTKKELRASGVLPGAINIPVDELRNRSNELDKKTEIVLYCGVGLRSYIGLRILKMSGFDKVRSLAGGISSWTYSLDDFSDDESIQ